MEAITREEKIMSGENLKPITRKEMFLAKAAGMDVETPEPITREEMFLSKIVGGGGGITPTGTLDITENGEYDVTAFEKANVNVTGSGGGEEWIGDGNTHIWITLQEGRTSPMLGVCPNGTVTVDWGDGTTPDVLTGTSVTTVQWTPTHEYAKAGDYVIKLTVDGEMGFYGSALVNQYSAVLRYSSEGDARNQIYQSSVRKVEAGDSVVSIGTYAFRQCHSLASISIPDSVVSIGTYAFEACYSLASITIPDGVTSIGGSVFRSCQTLASITIPDGVTSIGNGAFRSCYSLASVSIPNSVTSIVAYAFDGCYSLASITIPDGVTSIGQLTFQHCYSLASVSIPNSVTSIGNSAFKSCYSLASISIPNSVVSIGTYAFQYCYGARYYDFTTHTSVPTLSSANAFSDISADCEIRVPSALYDEWIAATNWSTYANNIVAV